MAIKTVPIILYFIVGVVSLVMAQKSLFSKGFISFHEEAAGMPLMKLDQSVQNVILGLMRTTGLGFLVVGMLLLVFPVINYFKSEKIIGLGIPIVCGVYCFGLFLANYQLHKKSGKETPWKGSLIAVVIIVVGIIISIL
jgi:uncharacterized membrane protein YidH (DUF202 family)